MDFDLQKHMAFRGSIFFVREGCHFFGPILQTSHAKCESNFRFARGVSFFWSYFAELPCKMRVDFQICLRGVIFVIPFADFPRDSFRGVVDHENRFWSEKRYSRRFNGIAGFSRKFSGFEGAPG